jgi:hypothetical protein
MDLKFLFPFSKCLKKENAFKGEKQQKIKINLWPLSTDLSVTFLYHVPPNFYRFLK